MANANEELQAAAARHAVGLQRYSAATVRKVLALVARVEGDVLARLATLDPESFTAQRLERFLTEMREIHREGYKAVTAGLLSELEDLAAYEGDFTRRTLQSAVEANFTAPTRAQLVAAVNSRPFQGRFLREWMVGLDDGAARRVRDAIRIGFVEGDSIQQITRRIRGTAAARYQDGILAINRRGAEMVTRTAVNHTAARAREETYRQNEDVVQGVQWVAILDSRTSTVCASRDGNVYEIDKGPRPPAHPNCRSTTAAVVRGIPPADRTRYEDWLRGQPQSVQVEVLGAERARLFREGRLSLDRFVDRRGREWTLDELKRREAQAFAE